MAKTNKPIYCWDTGVLLAWLLQEKIYPLADIALVVDAIDKESANLLIPAPVFSEVFEMSLTRAQKDQFQGFIDRSNIFPADLTMPIARRASQIREAGHNEHPQRKLKTVDAQIIATALSYNADVLHAFDSDLLKLNGHATVNGLKISKPIPLDGQKGLC